MFAGHFGVAAAVRAKSPNVPLWALMAATQLLDILFVPLMLTNVETIDSTGGTHYGEAVIHADYTHSLVGMLLISVLAGWAAAKAWGRRGGVTVGAVVASHWVLDLFVHRADMPILPGNAGDLTLLGFGLWKYPGWSAAAEIALVAVGCVMYAMSLRRRSAHSMRKGRAWAAGLAMGLLLCLSFVTDFLGI